MQSPGSEGSRADSSMLSGPQQAARESMQEERHPPRQHYHRQWHLAPNSGPMPLARFLGWFSIGLGVAELLAPRHVARGSGVPERSMLVRALGMREIVSGVGILSQKQPSNWLWSRVAGDAIDLALLGAGASKRHASRKRAAVAAAAVAGITVLDVLTSVQQTRRERKQGKAPDRGDIWIETSIAIHKPPRECYDFWRKLENLPRFMEHLQSVQVLDERRSRWTAHAPAGSEVEWESEITADQPGELLAWHSLPGSRIENAGTVRFESNYGERGTLLRVELQYRPPGGMAGAMAAMLFNEEPSQQIADDLRRFKWLIETGEMPTTIGQPAGPRSMAGKLFRKGQPG